MLRAVRRPSRAARLFHEAVELWEPDRDRVSAASYLADQQRDLLRPLIRRWNVRYAAFRLSYLRFVQATGVLSGAAVCLLAPVAVVAEPAVKELAPGDLILASLSYVAVFSVLSACFFQWVGSGLLFRLGMACAGVAILSAAIAATLVPHVIKAVQFGLVAAALAAVIMAVGYLAGNLVGRYFWFPLRRRSMASLPPSAVAAVLLWYLADHFDEALRAWRHASTRLDLLRWISGTAFWLEVRMPRAMWLAGYRGPAYDEVLRHYRCVGSFVREQAWRMIDAGDRAAFARIRDDLAEQAIAVRQGDWASLPAAQPRAHASWVLVVTRRLVTPVLLGGAALLLPHLPDIKLSGPALTSLQAALLVTAILSLSPLDPSSRGEVFGALTGLQHRR